MSEREMDATKIIENINRGMADGLSKAKSWIDQENEAKDELLRDAAEQWEKSKDRQDAGRSFYRGFDEGWSGGVDYGRDPQNPTPNRYAADDPAPVGDKADLLEQARQFLSAEQSILSITGIVPKTSQIMADFAAQVTAADKARIEELEGKVRELEAMLSRTNDIRGFSWHIQRRRENGQIEWFSTSAESGSVFGPFTSALEAFAALEEI